MKTKCKPLYLKIIFLYNWGILLLCFAVYGSMDFGDIPPALSCSLVGHPLLWGGEADHTVFLMFFDGFTSWTHFAMVTFIVPNLDQSAVVFWSMWSSTPVRAHPHVNHSMIATHKLILCTCESYIHEWLDESICSPENIFSL